jgi:hypothetical protein
MPLREEANVGGYTKCSTVLTLPQFCMILDGLLEGFWQMEMAKFGDYFK